MTFDLTNDENEERLANIKWGRTRLAEWVEGQPANFFIDDRGFQRALEFLLGEEGYRPVAARLYRFGATAARVIDPLVRRANETANLPYLERFDGIGQRVEDVVFPEVYHEAGKHIYGSGVMSVLAEPGNNVASLSLFYISAMNGEAGHNCPLACTAGVIKILQHVADDDLRERYLAQFLESDYSKRLHGAQFLTEIQGGSDVGANSTFATRLDTNSDIWLLNGEKWFCSNITADVALVTARLPAQGEGTKGLGLFLVPRHLEDGALNNVYIRRLKDKLGTRSMASAEIELKDAVAYMVGRGQEGFKNMMRHVINPSRLYNGMACTANARRAYVVARTYAMHRQSFGRPLVQYPLIQQTLVEMRSDASAMLAGTLRLAKMWDDLELGKAAPDTDRILRLGLTLNKFRTAVLAHEVINKGIEVLGGNGAIESFSVLPRLLRDNVVYENWEGPHNVLLAQAQRDMRRYLVHQPFLTLLQSMFTAIADDRVKREGLQMVAQMDRELADVLQLDATSASLYFRPLMEQLTDLYYLACLSLEGMWSSARKQDHSKRRLADFFLDRHLLKREPKDIVDYPDKISRLCAEIRPTRVDRGQDDLERDD